MLTCVGGPQVARLDAKSFQLRTVLVCGRLFLTRVVSNRVVEIPAEVPMTAHAQTRLVDEVVTLHKTDFL